MAFQIDFKSSKAVPNFLLFAQGPASGADNGDLEYHTAQTYLPSEFAEGTFTMPTHMHALNESDGNKN